MKHKNIFMRIRPLFSAITSTALLLVAGSAHAVGWTTAANNISDLGTAAVTAIVILCAAGGVGAIGFAGKLLLKKGGERGDDVEWSKVGYATLAGAFLLSISYIATTTVETLGGNSAEIGKSVNIAR